jgi:hypothetical protein
MTGAARFLLTCEEVNAEIAKGVNDAQIAAAYLNARDSETDWDALCHGLGRNDLPFLLLLVWDYLPSDQYVSTIPPASRAAHKGLPPGLPRHRQPGHRRSSRTHGRG